MLELRSSFGLARMFARPPPVVQAPSRLRSLFAFPRCIKRTCLSASTAELQGLSTSAPAGEPVVDAPPLQVPEVTRSLIARAVVNDHFTSVTKSMHYLDLPQTYQHNSDTSLLELQIRIGYLWKNPALLGLALTHPSASLQNNSKLAWLGDAALCAVVSEQLLAAAPQVRSLPQ